MHGSSKAVSVPPQVASRHKLSANLPIDGEAFSTRGESSDLGYGSVVEDVEIELPSNVFVSVATILILSGVFVIIAYIGYFIVRSDVQKRHVLYGVLSCFLLAFALAFVLGAGMSILVMPDYFLSFLRAFRSVSPMGSSAVQIGSALVTRSVESGSLLPN